MKIKNAYLAKQLGGPFQYIRTLTIRFGGMKTRCYNPNAVLFHRYGGRGIRICSEWLNDPTAFFRWAISSGFKPELQIDRIDNDGNYCPENCRWVTASENCRNRKPTYLRTESSRRNLGLVNREFNITRSREVFSKPVRCVETGVVYSSQTEAARAIGVSRTAVYLVLQGVNRTAKGFSWELL
jgi:hypothetical protein